MGSILKTKARDVDMTRCLVCNHKFQSHDLRSNVYLEDFIAGAIHESCYGDMFPQALPVAAVFASAN